MLKNKKKGGRKERKEDDTKTRNALGSGKKGLRTGNRYVESAPCETKRGKSMTRFVQKTYGRQCQARSAGGGRGKRLSERLKRDAHHVQRPTKVFESNGKERDGIEGKARKKKRQNPQFSMED